MSLVCGGYCLAFVVELIIPSHHYFYFPPFFLVIRFLIHRTDSNVLIHSLQIQNSERKSLILIFVKNKGVGKMLYESECAL